MNSEPNQPEAIQLTKVQETLMIPLWAKAADFRSPHSILHDEQANRIVGSIDYDFEKVSKGFGRELLVVRSRQYDDWLKDFLRRNPEAVVLHTGCGLDARITRIDPGPGVRWFDVDYPEVIELREKFYHPRAGYQMLSASLADPAWLEKIPNDRPAMLIADGVLEYLTREQVAALLKGVTEHFPHGEAAFDIMSPSAVQSARSELPDESGPLHKWEVEDVREVDQLNDGMQRINELSLVKVPYIGELPLLPRLSYGLMGLIPRARNLLRLLRYRF
jgi:O-methyltransferase involved in polyketide biosynthesis